MCNAEKRSGVGRPAEEDGFVVDPFEFASGEEQVPRVGMMGMGDVESEFGIARTTEDQACQRRGDIERLVLNKLTWVSELERQDGQGRTLDEASDGVLQWNG